MNKLLLGKACIAIASVITIGPNAAETIRYVPGEIIVKFKPGVNTQNFLTTNRSLASMGLKPKREIKLSYQILSKSNYSEQKPNQTN